MMPESYQGLWYNGDVLITYNIQKDYMLNQEDIRDHICQELFNLDIKGLANTLFWFAGDRDQYRKYLKRLSPECYTAITTSKKNVPKLVNHPEEYIRMIANYRLQHNK